MRIPVRSLVALLATATMLASFSPCAFGAWLAGGTAVCTAAGDQHAPQCVADGAGGAFVIWFDQRPGNYDIYAQRLDGLGNTLWTSNGVRVSLSNAANSTAYHGISDGAGGLIVAWGESGGLRAQRLNSAGVAQWASGGVDAGGGSTHVRNFGLCSDGHGGAEFVWEDYRSGSCVFGYLDVYAARLDSAGTSKWTAGGVPVCTAPQDQMTPIPEPDGAGGVILAWQDHRLQVWDIYAHRLNAAGTTQWGNNAVCTAPDNQMNFDAAGTASGVMACWEDYRFDEQTPTIYLQRMSLAGTGLFALNGVRLATLGPNYSPRIAAVSNGAVVAYNHGVVLNAQRVDSTGAILWGSDGVAVSSISPCCYDPASIVGESDDGAIVSWADYRSGTDFDIYAQRLGPMGASQWTVNGLLLSATTGMQRLPSVVTDGADGAIVAWEDNRSGGYDIYAQRVSAGGIVGPTTSVESIGPGRFGLIEVRPNPSRASVELDMTVPTTSTVVLEVYDLQGRRVRTLRSVTRAPGIFSMTWDGRGEDGTQAPSGIYMARMRCGASQIDTHIALAR